MPTFYDLITNKGNDVLTGLVEDVTTFAPEFGVIPVTTRPGTTYKINKRTALPTAGFRDANQGISPQKSAYKQEVKEMFFLDVPINVDEMIYKGDDRSTGDLLSHEMQGALQSAFITVGSQTYYGAVGDNSNGFVGLRSQLSGQVSVSGSLGSAPSNAATSSTCYGLWLNEQGVGYDVGNQGSIDLKTPILQQIPDPNGAAGKNIFAWVTNLSFYVGLSVKSNYSVYAITGISNHTITATNALGRPQLIFDQGLTDFSATNLLIQVPLNRRVGFTWFTNRTGIGTLQSNRSAINFQAASAASGTPAYSPPPLVMEGFPIVVTDSITNTENNS